MTFEASFSRTFLPTALAAVLVAALLLVAPPSVAQDATAKHVTAPESLAELGVPGYRLLIDGSSASAELLSPEKATIGNVRFSWNVEEGTLVELEWVEAHLLLYFHPMEGEFQLTDMRTGQVVGGTLGEDGWEVDARARTLLDLYADQIELLSLIHDDAYFNHVQGPKLGGSALCNPGSGGIEPAPLPDVAFGDGITALPSEGRASEKPCFSICNGPLIRGTNLAALSRSACCAEARNDANVKCWNQWCIGCCQFFSCDAFCVVGDYLCTPCGITGRACSGLNCSPPPPPPCGSITTQVDVLELGRAGTYEMPSPAITLQRLEASDVVHHGTNISYLMAEWAVLSFGAEKATVERASIGFDSARADELAASLSGRAPSKAGRSGIALVVATPPHEANSRDIPLPTLHFTSTGLPAGLAEGQVAVRADFAEDGHLQAFEVLHDNIGGVPPELLGHLEAAVSMQFHSEKQHRVVAFAVLSIGDVLTLDAQRAYLPKCCCGDHFCV